MKEWVTVTPCVRGRKVVAYLKSLMCVLSWGNIFTTGRDLNNSHIIIVTSEESLLSFDNMPNNDGATQWENKMLIIWMEYKAFLDGS